MLLELANINYFFDGKTILDNINLKVMSGEIVGLIGPNGAGKSSILKVANGIFSPNSGKVTVKSIYDTPIKIGYVPEERGLYLNMSLAENLHYFAKLQGVKLKSDREQKVKYWLEKVGLLDHENEKVKTLSKGNQQKIQIIIALLHDPHLLILDEPFSGFDPVVEEEMITLLQEIKGQEKGILLSTHRMDSVEDLCDRLYMINKAKLILEGKVEDIKHKYAATKIIVRGKGEFKNADKKKDIGEFCKATYQLNGGDEINTVIEAICKNNQVFDIHTQSATMKEIFLKSING